VYTLSPLSKLRKHIKPYEDFSKLTYEIDKATISKIEATFDKLLFATQKFNDFSKYFEGNDKFVKKSQWDEIYSKAQAIKISEATFKDRLKTKLKEKRSGKFSWYTSSIQDVVDNFIKCECSPKKILDFIEAHNWLITRFGQISRDQAKGMIRDFIIRYIFKLIFLR